jgi:hypothetical protein
MDRLHTIIKPKIDTMHYRENGINFSCVIQKDFTTKLHNFTKLKMFFNAVMMNFTISKVFKILSIIQSLNYSIR